MLKETVIKDLDVEAKPELREHVRGTIQSRNDHMARFVDQILFSYKQLGDSTTANASKAPAAEQTFEYFSSFLQCHDNKLHASKV